MPFKSSKCHVNDLKCWRRKICVEAFEHLSKDNSIWVRVTKWFARKNLLTLWKFITKVTLIVLFVKKVSFHYCSLIRLRGHLLDNYLHSVLNKMRTGKQLGVSLQNLCSYHILSVFLSIQALIIDKGIKICAITLINSQNGFSLITI